jgi:hypothetical protein
MNWVAGMDSCTRTCNDLQVPKPTTGKTPLRNMRVADDTWLPALAKADAEDRTLTDVVTAALRQYNAEPLAVPRQLSFANWPDAKTWLDEVRSVAFDAMDAEISAATGWPDPEWLAVAAWLASTRHPADLVQQRRVLTGFILGRALEITEGGWRDHYRDSRHLSATIQEILARHLPLVEDQQG